MTGFTLVCWAGCGKTQDVERASPIRFGFELAAVTRDVGWIGIVDMRRAADAGVLQRGMLGGVPDQGWEYPGIPAEEEERMSESEIDAFFAWRNAQRKRHRVMTVGEYMAWCRSGDANSANSFPGGITILLNTQPVAGRFAGEQHGGPT